MITERHPRLPEDGSAVARNALELELWLNRLSRHAKCSEDIANVWDRLLWYRSHGAQKVSRLRRLLLAWVHSEQIRLLLGCFNLLLRVHAK